MTQTAARHDRWAVTGATLLSRRIYIGRMGTYVGPAELVAPQTDAVIAVTATLASTEPSFTALGHWQGDLKATPGHPDPFVDLLGVDGLALTVGTRKGEVVIKSCTAGGQVAQVVGVGEPPF